MTDTENRAGYIAGLRALADILDTHPELPLPYQGQDAGTGFTFHFLASGENAPADMAAARDALGVPVEQEISEKYFDLHGNLDGLYFTLTSFVHDTCGRPAPWQPHPLLAQTGDKA